MEFNDFLYKMRGIDPDAKKAYLSLFNSSSTRTRGNKVLDDLKVHFRFYGEFLTALSAIAGKLITPYTTCV